MANTNPNPDTTAAKVESSTENVSTNSSNQKESQNNENTGRQDNNYGGGRQDNNSGGGRRGGFQGNRGGGGGPGRFGPGNNRRPNNPNFVKNENNFQGPKRPRGNYQGGPNSGGGPREQGQGGRNPDERLNEKLSQFCGPTYELPAVDSTEKKFAGRARLYIGNIAPEVTEEELNDIFKRYGETHELFVNKEKNFAFIRLDYHGNAEKAKRELDGYQLKSRSLKIRYAPCGSTVKVSNLTPFVSNELLYWTFSIFGEIERCIINVDDRGKSTGDAIIEFARKGSAGLAIRKCTEDCLFLTSSLRPVIVEQYDVVDDTEGYPEKNIPKKNPDYMKEREVGPRFANLNSFEHEYGLRWKQLHELHSQKIEAVKKEFDMEKEKLEAQMDYARFEHETEMLREQLRSREMDRDRQKREWEIKERQAEESRQRNEELMRRQTDDLQSRMNYQEKEMIRRQAENSLFMQAHQLDNMLEQEEQAYDQPNERGFQPNNNLQNELGGSNDGGMEQKPFMNSFERNHRFDGRDMGPRGGGGNMGGRGHWVNEGRGNRDDFPNKRRRY